MLNGIVSALFPVTADDVVTTSDDYYTPRWIFDAAGFTFDMDVAAPVAPEFRTCPARRYLTVLDDGLRAPWSGLVWMNPPFSQSRPWVERFAAHHCGLALLPAVKGRQWNGVLMRSADAIALITTDFSGPDGSVRAMPYALILAACGEQAVEAVGRVATADKYLNGAYHVRPAETL